MTNIQNVTQHEYEISKKGNLFLLLNSLCGKGLNIILLRIL